MNVITASSICLHTSPQNVVTRVDTVTSLAEYFYIICLLQENIWKDATVFIFSLFQKYNFRIIIVGHKEQVWVGSTSDWIIQHSFSNDLLLLIKKKVTSYLKKIIIISLALHISSLKLGKGFGLAIRNQQLESHRNHGQW